MRRLMGAVLVASSLATAAACRHAPPRAMPVPNPANMLVTTAWLAEHQSDRDLVMLHVGSKAQYDSGHIAGARHTALDEVALPNVPGGLTLQLAGVEQLTAWAVRNGIGDRTRVIVIPHDGALQSATRVFITLAYLGAMDRISLLNGSYQAWKSESRAVTTTAPGAAPSATFTPKLRPDIIATIAQVEAATNDNTRHIVDARLTRFFNGDGGGYPRPGHIPTAVNVPLSSVSTNGYLKPIGELKTLFAHAGVDQSKPVITYCHIGQQATLLWFVATMLGHDARMFDGSFQEWSGTARLPVVGPPAK
ncbi:rhodanese-like domain-containing protein [Gemmatimonas sp.]|uniref:sulfurtransferase n=1 Tax=Gemmatimonas sp. TaxID=1962908 RepID=UPI00286B05ED|nr:rhodanese-like domain-containing protein [Gemmatimonas sp.]